MSDSVSTSARWLGRVAAIAMIVAIAQPALAANAHSRKLDRALARIIDNGGQTTRVIVRVRPGQDALIKEALRRSKATLRYEHASISALTVDIDASQLDALAGLDGVESV